LAPTTTFNRDTVQVDWIAPFNGGFPITGYKIYIRESDLETYTYELNGCDGTNPAIRDAETCTIQVPTLRLAPFSLPWGSSVWSKIIAYNFYGDSDISEPGNGAVIITYPDAPIDLTETVIARTPSTITFSWNEGFANGGSPVLDYRIVYDQAAADFIELAANHETTSITATGLQYGLIYTFRVESRNEFGHSTTYSEITILCAAEPEAPGTPSTVVVFDEVIMSWNTPIDNGTPIT
jgi:hypothetical protein